MPGAKWYQQRRAVGVCTQCGSQPALSGETCCAGCVESRRANRDAKKAYDAIYQKQYFQKHREEHLVLKQARRTRMLGNGGAFTAQEWRDLKTYYDYTCLACGRREPQVKLHADHIVPLSRGGSSYICNIQPLCNTCNASKGTKTIDYRGAVGQKCAS